MWIKLGPLAVTSGGSQDKEEVSITEEEKEDIQQGNTGKRNPILSQVQVRLKKSWECGQKGNGWRDC